MRFYITEFDLSSDEKSIQSIYIRRRGRSLGPTTPPRSRTQKVLTTSTMVDIRPLSPFSRTPHVGVLGTQDWIKGKDEGISIKSVPTWADILSVPLCQTISSVHESVIR